MGKIVHFEITADDVERASEFYTSVFGWKSEPSPFVGGYHTVETGEGEGINGAIMKREYQPQPTIAWLSVEDIDAAMAMVQSAGGSLVNEKSFLPGNGYVAYIKDTEGNTLGLIQPVTPTS